MDQLYPGEKMKSSVGVEYRKLQVTGGSTYIVSLPKRWITENNLKPSDTVGIEHLSSGEIQISPKENKNLRRTGPGLDQVSTWRALRLPDWDIREWCRSYYDSRQNWNRNQGTKNHSTIFARHSRDGNLSR